LNYLFKGIKDFKGFKDFNDANFFSPTERAIWGVTTPYTLLTTHYSLLKRVAIIKKLKSYCCAMTLPRNGVIFAFKPVNKAFNRLEI